jgi:integrase
MTSSVDRPPRITRGAGLRIEDLDFRFGAAVIRRTLSDVNGSLYLKDTKNHRVRVVPLPEVLISELVREVPDFLCLSRGRALLDGPPVTVRIVEEGEGVEDLQITLYGSESASLLVV